MKFSRIVFRVAAVYGFLTLLPLYFIFNEVGRSAPPPITHPEFYFGFVGVTMLWQVVFFVISLNPIRYRALMLVAICEKLVYTVPVVILFLTGMAPSSILWPAVPDPIFGALFIAAYLKTPNSANDYR